MTRMAECHPDTAHYAKGLCSKCYVASTKDKRAQQKKQYRELNKERLAADKKAYYEANKVAILARQKQQYDDNPEVIKERVNRYRENNPEVIAERKRKQYAQTAEASYIRRYGMTSEDIEQLLLKQDCKCAICADAIDMQTKRVDHCHETGYVRGLLCWNCNTGIGKLGDNVDGLMRAVHYLQQPHTKFQGQVGSVH